MHVYIDTENFKAATIGELDFVGDIFKLGMRVKIICGPRSLDGTHSYYGQYIGCEGEVVRIPQSTAKAMAREAGISLTIGVKLDGKYNERSQFGCYWFRPDELIITEMENNKMLLLKGYKIAQVAIESYGDQYVAHYEEALEEGDRVVVANDEGYHCGIVSNVFTEAHMNRVPKFQIVCKIDDSAFCGRIDRAKKSKELEGKLKTAVADYQQIALYEMLAEKSPEIAALLKELKEVTNG